MLCLHFSLLSVKCIITAQNMVKILFEGTHVLQKGTVVLIFVRVKKDILIFVSASVVRI